MTAGSVARPLSGASDFLFWRDGHGRRGQPPGVTVLVGEHLRRRSAQVAEQQPRISPLLAQRSVRLKATRRRRHRGRQRDDFGAPSRALQQCDIFKQRPRRKPAEFMIERSANHYALIAEAGEHTVETSERAAGTQKPPGVVEAQPERRDLRVCLRDEMSHDGVRVRRQRGIRVQKKQPVAGRGQRPGMALHATAARGRQDRRPRLPRDRRRGIRAPTIDDDDARFVQPPEGAGDGVTDPCGLVERRNDHSERKT